MGREIKFRGFSISKKQWIYGYYVCSNDCLIHEGSYGDIWSVYSESVGQYTGIKDIQGKEIYKGDILLTDNREVGLGLTYSWVEFKDGSFVVREKGCSSYMTLSELLVLDPRVVGNTYENAELLEDV